MSQKNDKKNPILNTLETESPTNYAMDGSVAANNVNAPIFINNVKTNADLSLEDVLQYIMNSSSNDWLLNTTGDDYILTLKSNVEIRLRTTETDLPVRFSEEWVNIFPDENAYREVYELSYKGVPIKKYWLVKVDGSRAAIPFPKSRKVLTIDSEQYKIAQIVNEKLFGNRLDEYLNWADFQVDDINFMSK